MIYNSRKKFYKKPFGAVKVGESITFRIKVPKEYETKSAYLSIAKDYLPLDHHMMCLSNTINGYDVYECKISIDKGPAPYWYHFQINTKNGIKFISRGHAGEGYISDEVYSFQLTVYDGSYEIPSWYGEGITYNIFPDRFNRTSIPKEIPGRVVHEDWSDIPVYLPDSKGEILNNDFFGGNLQGIIEKLDYLKELNVSTIYLNPIFEAYSNHRYDTGDYKTIDKYLGSEEDFKELCKKASDLGMKIILDGVFSHTGYDSVYFNAKEKYDNLGAYNSEKSPYYEWYTFYGDSKDDYKSWWGIYTLPEVNEMNPSYMDFIIESADSVINKWIGLGASGFRLDVADELPDEFINRLNVVSKQKKSDAIVIGEVWEDASIKESHGGRRKYVYGQYLDSVMNYVLKDAVLDFLKNGGAERLRETVETLKENYPKDFFYSLMNIIGTHDTKRIVTELVGGHFDTREERAKDTLSDEQKMRGIALLKIASLIQYTMPGSPCLYYGDEVLVEGHEDPFNRRTYPWGKENQEVLSWYKWLGNFRVDNDCIIKGDIEFLYAKDYVIAYRREFNGEKIDFYINMSDCMQEICINGKEMVLERFEIKIEQN